MLSTLCPLVLVSLGDDGHAEAEPNAEEVCTFRASLTTAQSGALPSPSKTATMDLDSVLGLVVCSEHDVRVAAIKGVRKCLKRRRSTASSGTSTFALSSSAAATFERLDAALSASLESETYAPSQRRLLHCLGMVRAELRASGGPAAMVVGGGEGSDDGEAEGWALLERLFATGRGGGGDSAVAAMALEAMGWALLHDRQRYAVGLRVYPASPW